MNGNIDFARFMSAVGVRSLNEKCFGGWITVDRLNGDTTFCRLPLDKAVPFVWAGWLLPIYKADGQLSHLSWRGPTSAERRLGVNYGVSKKRGWDEYEQEIARRFAASYISVQSCSAFSTIYRKLKDKKPDPLWIALARMAIEGEMPSCAEEIDLEQLDFKGPIQ
jgi:hypothetical protein